VGCLNLSIGTFASKLVGLEQLTTEYRFAISMAQSTNILVLDGALGTELQSRGKDVSNSLWSASLLVNDPQAIYDVHKDYLEAGADIIITSTYQASVEGFLAWGCSSETEALNLMKKSVQLAIEARDNYVESNKEVSKRRPWVAASIGPYGAYLANGSEYTGDYGEPRGYYLSSFHEPRLRAILECSPDILAIETIPRVEEAMAILELLQRLCPTMPFYLSFSIQRADSPILTDLLKLRKFGYQFPNTLLAIGVNCCPLNHTTAIVRTLHEIFPTIPLIVYPNSGEPFDPETKQWAPTPDEGDLSSMWKTWVTHGAYIVGGCCRTRPTDIAKLRKMVDEHIEVESKYDDRLQFEYS
jgi:homocysteine S-methyltransferase